MLRIRRCIKFQLTLALVLGLFGCSVYMESTRPTPVDVSQFQPGQNRDFVLEQLGAPQSTVTESDGASCDFYKLYTRGYGAGGKIPIAIAEGAADVFTLGLPEAITTPAEGATKNDLHPVTFCYKNGSLIRVVRQGSPASEAGVPESQTPAQPSPAVSISAAQPSARSAVVANATSAPAVSTSPTPPSSPANAVISAQPVSSNTDSGHAVTQPQSAPAKTSM
jgi:hypothetical protein